MSKILTAEAFKELMTWTTASVERKLLDHDAAQRERIAELETKVAEYGHALAILQWERDANKSIGSS